MAALFAATYPERTPASQMSPGRPAAQLRRWFSSLVDVLATTIGFAVEAVNGTLGTVAGVRQEDAGTFFVARTPSGREHLLSAGVIEEIDVAERRIRVYRSTREIDAAPTDPKDLARHYAPWGAGHRVLPAERSRTCSTADGGTWSCSRSTSGASSTAPRTPMRSLPLNHSIPALTGVSGCHLGSTRSLTNTPSTGNVPGEAGARPAGRVFRNAP
jgi:hypothetical protein